MTHNKEAPDNVEVPLSSSFVSSSSLGSFLLGLALEPDNTQTASSQPVGQSGSTEPANSLPDPALEAPCGKLSGRKHSSCPHPSRPPSTMDPWLPDLQLANVQG